MIETPVFGHAAVATPDRLAAETGQQILAQGGNALEAMVAMAATIAVTYPHMNSIGGDNFWLIADASRKIRFLDGAGAAGELATPARYRKLGHDTVPIRGPLAALTVPGAISGWILALEAARALGGRLPLATLLADAIRHAKDGMPVSPFQARVGGRPSAADLAGMPGFRDLFMSEGQWLAAGSPLRQPTLAATLDHLVHAGLDDFYRGDVGREVAADFEGIGIPVTRLDLKRHQASARAPLELPLQGVRLYNSPPPTQGLASLVATGLFERLGVNRPETFEHIHGLVEALKRAFAVRDRVITDPRFQREDPEDYLDAAFLDREAAAISMTRAARSPTAAPDGDTVWMGAIDSSGLAVSMIQSIFHEYGSGVILPKTGILMHNRGISFSLDPTALNLLSPGRKPFHTLNPAMALFDDGRTMPYGTRGGDGQPQFLAQLFSRYRLGQGLAEAVDAPRFVLTKPSPGGPAMLSLEGRFDDRLVAALDRAGHMLFIDVAYGDNYGHCGALVRHAKSGRIEAMHDPRSDGGALGL